MELSIVIICRNERRFIQGCIEKALSVARIKADREVVLVDSCSTDGTIEIASQYPISIFQLRPHWRHTPAAGRFIGFLRSHGEFILFVDGDSDLKDGFVEQAVELFRSRPDVAAISGRRREIYWKGEKVVGEEEDINKVGPVTCSKSVAPGSAIYRRSALEKVGCFNPYLFSEEEAELGERLIMGGFKIVAVPLDMVVHNTVPREDVGSFFRRLRANFLLGRGQAVRLRIHQGLSPQLFLRKTARAIQTLLWLLTGLCCVFLSALNSNHWFVTGWLTLSLGGFLLFAMKNRSLATAARYLLIWPIEGCFIVKGFLLKPCCQNDYPTDVSVVNELR